MSSDHSCMNIRRREVLRSSSGHEWTRTPYFHVIHTHTDTWEECFLPRECLPTSLAAPISPTVRGSPAGCSWMGPPHHLYLQEAWAVPHRKWAEETVSCVSCPLIASVTHSNLLWNGTESEDFSSDVLFPGGIKGHEFFAAGYFPSLYTWSARVFILAKFANYWSKSLFPRWERDQQWTCGRVQGI